VLQPSFLQIYKGMPVIRPPQKKIDCKKLNFSPKRNIFAIFAVSLHPLPYHAVLFFGEQSGEEGERSTTY